MDDIRNGNLATQQGSLTPKQQFVYELGVFINRVSGGPQFRGKTQALKALRRIRELAVFTHD